MQRAGPFAAYHAVHARRGILRGLPALRCEHAHDDAGFGGRPDDVEDSLLCPPWPGAPCCPFSPGQPWFNRSVACAWQAEHNVLIEGGRRDEARRLLDPALSEVYPATSARRAALACSRHAAAVQAASLLPRCATQHRKDSSRRRRCAGTRSFQRRSMTRPWLSSAPSAGPYRCSFVCLVVVRVCARENVLWPEDSCVVTFVSLRSSVPLLRLLWEGYDPGRTPRRGGASFAIPTFKKPVRFCATRARRSPRSRTCLQKTVAFSIGLLCPTVGNSRRA